KEQVSIACDVGKPVVVLQRQAHKELLSTLQEFGSRLPSVIVHNFTGSAQEALEYIQNGYFLALTGGVFKDKSDQGLSSLITGGQIPIENLIFASDAPFMFPNMKAARSEQS